MLTSGIIIGIVSLIFSLGGTLLSPICTPCVAFILGPISGFLASNFEKNHEKTLTIKRGAYSGAIAGIGGLLGQVIGAIINAIVVGPEGAAAIIQSFGYNNPTTSGFGVGYWFGIVASTICISLFNMLIMTGLGAAGALLWWNFIGSKKIIADAK